MPRKQQQPDDPPPLWVQMRALAEKKPNFAHDLRITAQAFEDAARNFRACHPDLQTVYLDKMIDAWREANKVFVEAKKLQPGEVASHME